MTAKIIPLHPKPRQPRRRKKHHSRARRRYHYFQSFGRRLRYARHQLGISEAEAAAAFGVSVRTYRGYEAGKPPRDSSLGFLDFAYELDLSLPWLLGRTGSLPPRFRLRVV